MIDKRLNKIILIIAIVLGVATYQLWSFFPKGFFYVGNALFIMLLSVYIYAENKNIVTFVLFGYSINNLLDEFIFNPKEFGSNEIIIAIVIPLIYYLKKKRGFKK